MPDLNAISPDKLARLLGTPNCPTIVEVRSDDEREPPGAAIPSSLQRTASTVAEWGAALAPRPTIVACTDGNMGSPGVAAWLRHLGSSAQILEGGKSAWAASGYPLIPFSKVPRASPGGPSVWVTRARPKVDRVACPWLIRRFVDREAVFLFVAPADIPAVAAEHQAIPFDVDGVFWSHRGDSCTFDAMVEEFGLVPFEPLARLAVIVRGADTARPELAPQAAGLLAVSLGLSRMYSDDLQQVEAGMLIYDALYRWCRDAMDETHDWTSHAPKPRRER
jgi:rhodanese-related sulfurtransferase